MHKKHTARRLRQLLSSRLRTRTPHELVFIILIYHRRSTLSTKCTALCAGTPPLRSLLGKRARVHNGDEAADDLFRCTSARSDVSEASHYSGEGVAAGGGGFVTPNTPIQVPACVAWAPRGPGLAGAAAPAPDLYGWEADGCRTPDQPIPAPSGPPPAPSRRDRAQPSLRGGERPGLPALHGQRRSAVAGSGAGLLTQWRTPGIARARRTVRGAWIAGVSAHRSGRRSTQQRHATDRACTVSAQAMRAWRRCCSSSCRGSWSRPCMHRHRRGALLPCRVRTICERTCARATRHYLVPLHPRLLLAFPPAAS